jgi:hypothetical protein
MTTNERDFDRLARAWLELGPNEAPERSIAAVLQAIETTPQVRRPWRWPTWRASTMSRITILAVLAGTIAIIVGGLVLSGGTPSLPAPTVAPSPAQAAATPSVGPATLPAALRGGWVAPSRGTTIENLTQGPQDALGGNAKVTTVVFAGAADFTPGPGFWLDRRGTALLRSSVAEESPGVVRLTMTTSADPNCVGRDSGTYRWSPTADGQWVTFELIEDACEMRAAILTGTWQRSLAHDSAGGPGIAAVLEPYLTFTLPPATYRGRGLGGRDELVIDRADDGMSFKVWRDLDGFVDPCDRSKGRLLIEPGMDAFLAYLREDARFTVTEEQEFEIDGHRAVRVDFQLGANLAEPCWDFDGDPANKSGVLLWIPGAESNQDAFWNGELDTPGTIVVTEVDGVTLAFESVLVEPGGGFSTDVGLLDTVRFLDALPEPPSN